jgi:putative sugar O-methyltransferase
MLQKKVFFEGAFGNRSISDNGAYLLAVKDALDSYKKFTKFKQDPRYQAILEHSTKEQGAECLEIIKTESPSLLKHFDEFKTNDLVGEATTFDYEGIGLISPSTLRYVKVASDIINLFGKAIGPRIAEIGVGYGGQALIADKIFDFERYDLFDLQPVVALASKYLECHTLKSSYRVLTLNQHSGNFEYDLAISNYAFSELPSKLQSMYIRKILEKSKRGYLTMNSGTPQSAFQEDKLSLTELKAVLPTFEILPERPLTHPGNYIIAWGHQAE